MNPKSFPHPEQAPLGAGTGVAARPHPSRTIFVHAPTLAPRSAGADVARKAAPVRLVQHSDERA